jgi:SAM-dependent methyltransferase
VDAATVRSLTTPAARELLTELASLPPAELVGAPGLALASRLRRSHDAGLVAAATTLVSLRQRAGAKLGDDAPHLVLDRTGLEQATRASVASHRAARLARSDATTVVDLGCGIGADLLALARAGLRVTGVDRDPARVEMARANLAACSLPGQVIHADAHRVDLSAYDAAFVDPARRGGAGRSFDPAAWSPPWTFVQSLLVAEPARHAVVKTAPGLPHAMVPPRVEAEWVSDGGDLVEAALWGPSLATARRRATVLPAGTTLTDLDDPGPVPRGSRSSTCTSPTTPSRAPAWSRRSPPWWAGGWSTSTWPTSPPTGWSPPRWHVRSGSSRPSRTASERCARHCARETSGR